MESARAVVKFSDGQAVVRRELRLGRAIDALLVCPGGVLWN